MDRGHLGKQYRDGEVVVRQGETDDCMYVVQEGKVEVVRESDGHATVLAVLERDDFFGEMALFERRPRSATVRALGDARVLTVDKRTFLRRVHEDPSLAFRILSALCRRIRDLDAEVTRLRNAP